MLNIPNGKGLVKFFAELYIRLALAITPLRPGTKAAYVQGWTNNPTPAEHWEAHPDDGIAVIHALSGTAALDIDHEEYAKQALSQIGIDLDALFAGARHINTSKSRKLLFRVPEGVELPHRALVWPAPDGGNSRITVFELRAGNGRAEVLPPSVHPVTGERYTWVPDAPRSREDISEVPPELLDLWLRWDTFRPLLEACPWCEPVAKRLILRYQPHEGDECTRRLIERYNELHSIENLLTLHGYQRATSGRYIAPESTSGSPGVVIFNNGPRQFVYSFHKSDVLSDGRAHDAFDVMRILDHGGDWKAAFETAKRETGEDCDKTPSRRKGGVEVKAVEMTTGEVVDISEGTESLKNIPDEQLLDEIRARTRLPIDEIRGVATLTEEGELSAVRMKVGGVWYTLTMNKLANFNSFELVFALRYNFSPRVPSKKDWRATAMLIVEAARRNLEERRNPAAERLLIALREYVNDVAVGRKAHDGEDAEFYVALRMRNPVELDDGRVAFHLASFIRYAREQLEERFNKERLIEMLIALDFERVSIHIEDDARRLYREYYAIPENLKVWDKPPEAPKPTPPENGPSGVKLRFDKKDIEEIRAERIQKAYHELKRKKMMDPNRKPVEDPEELHAEVQEAIARAEAKARAELEELRARAAAALKEAEAQQNAQKKGSAQGAEPRKLIPEYIELEDGTRLAPDLSCKDREALPRPLWQWLCAGLTGHEVRAFVNAINPFRSHTWEELERVEKLHKGGQRLPNLLYGLLTEEMTNRELGLVSRPGPGMLPPQE